jgi:hypothetical protein
MIGTTENSLAKARARRISRGVDARKATGSVPLSAGAIAASAASYGSRADSASADVLW